MFYIKTTSGVELGIVDSVTYIKINKQNGCFNLCAKEDAIGIAYKSVAYNLHGHADIADAETVFISEVETGEVISMLKETTNILSAQLAEADEAAIQLYEANLALDQVTAEQDEAIIEIYEKIGELTNG